MERLRLGGVKWGGRWCRFGLLELGSWFELGVPFGSSLVAFFYIHLMETGGANAQAPFWECPFLKGTVPQEAAINQTRILDISAST